MIGHKKTKTGCKKCKARKVKCDETRPNCLACSRLHIQCEYSSIPSSGHSSQDTFIHQRDHTLELSLMHEWMAEICESLTPAKDFWKYEAAHLALRCHFLLNGVLAVAALRASRESTRRWPAKDAVEKHILRSTISTTDASSADGVVPLSTHDMVNVSRKFFHQSLQAYQDAVAALTTENIKSAFTCSALISFYSFLVLSEQVENDSLRDLVQWIGVASGINSIIRQWYSWLGPGWIDEAGLTTGEPSMRTEDSVFRPEYRIGFEHLLRPVENYLICPEDQRAYEDTLSYIGLMHRGIIHGSDSQLAICRRIYAMPARAPTRFIKLFRERDARALVVLAHFFAVVALAEEKVPWFQGTGKRQVPLLCEQIPVEYKALVEWPLSIVMA